MNRLQAMPRRPVTAAVATLAVATLTACGAGEGAGSSGGATDTDGFEVVASTSIYASIADTVLGEDGSVTAIVEDPTVDPHSFEASPADAARITNADLVVYNGAGYDAFVDQALGTAGDIPEVVGVEAFESATGTSVESHDHSHDDDHGHDEAHSRAGHGHDDAEHDQEAHHDDDHPGSTQNEHVWTSLPTARAVAGQIADELGRLDPDNADDYANNAAAFSTRIAELEREIEAVHESHAGTEYAQSEPIGQHLFDSMGLVDSTPPTFLSAIHAGSDPAARDFDAIIQLVSSGDIAFFAYNTQTETAVTTRIREAAEESGVPVIELTETLPEDTDYLTWIEDMTDRTAEALQR